MSDLISRADAIEEISKGVWNVHELVDRIKALPSADADGEDLIIKGAKGIQDGLYNIKDGKLFKYKGKGGTVRTYPIVPSADAVCEDTQTEERARFVAKETELAHIEAKLENAEKRLQGACTANFVAEQLNRLRKMTDEEKWNFFREFFGMGDAVQGEWVDWLGNGNEWECSVCKCSIESHGSIAYNYCPMCGARMKGGAI